MITTRFEKGAPLTHAEMDENITDFRDGVNIVVPKAAGAGLRIGPALTATYPWYDLTANLVSEPSGAGKPTLTIYRSPTKQLQFDVGEAIALSYVFPHTLVPATDIYVSLAWSFNSAFVIGGSVTWQFDRCYAKGHTQQSFSAPKTLTFVSPAQTPQYVLTEVEVRGTTPGGSATEFDTNEIEPDGMIIGVLSLVANDVLVSSGGIPKPFLHSVSIHYQGKVIGTANREPPYYA